MAEDTKGSEGLKEIPANEILDKIQSGEIVKYDHVIVKGDLDICKLDLPKENEKSSAVSQIEITKSQINGSVNFGDIIVKESAVFSDTTFSGTVNFSTTAFGRDANFSKATFSKDADFTRTTFGGHGDFSRAMFSGDAYFVSAAFSEYAYFEGATFSREGHFSSAMFSKEADFSRATFSRDSYFSRATFSGKAYFIGAKFSAEAYFIGAMFSGYAHFGGAMFSGDVLTFRDALFKFSSSQEGACRRAKNVLESSGNREEAGYHFYREMVGKRKQKSRLIRFPELVFLQYIFGYGVHPFRLWGFWLIFVAFFAILYGLGHGIDETASQLNGTAHFRDYMWFSIATAITPGLTSYKPIPGFRLVAGLEAIIGTFMWAAFIATFARKYMR